MEAVSESRVLLAIVPRWPSELQRLLSSLVASSGWLVPSIRFDHWSVEDVRCELCQLSFFGDQLHVKSS